MTEIEMDTGMARSASMSLSAWVGELRELRSLLNAHCRSLIPIWQSQSATDFQNTHDPLLLQLDSKITELDNLRQSLENCISAYEEIARKLAESSGTL
jgi:uncharacterized protein YukE